MDTTKNLAALLACTAVACGVPVLERPEDFYEFPAGTQIKTIDTTEMRDVWVHAGGEDPGTCPTIHEAVLDLQFFKSIAPNKMPSCYDPSFKAGTGNCDWAFTALIEDDVPTMMFAPPPSETPWVKGHSERVEQAHETYHAWLYCMTGDMDVNHKNPIVWKTMMDHFKAQDGVAVNDPVWYPENQEATK